MEDFILADVRLYSFPAPLLIEIEIFFSFGSYSFVYYPIVFKLHSLVVIEALFHLNYYVPP